MTSNSQSTCPRVWGFLWRSHHWHYDGIKDFPRQGCAEGGTFTRAAYHCCHCPAERTADPYD